MSFPRLHARRKIDVVADAEHTLDAQRRILRPRTLVVPFRVALECDPWATRDTLTGIARALLDGRRIGIGTALPRRSRRCERSATC